MILVKLRGGLSNQLFQYAAARSLALVHNTSVLIDKNWFAQIPEGATPRKYELDRFNISGKIASPFELAGTDGVRNAGLPDLPIALLRKIFPKWKFTQEKHFHFDPAFFDLPDQSCLLGYWVSEKYFSPISKIIREEFLFINTPDETNRKFISEMKSCNSVSVHVRRGDYVNNHEYLKIHGALPVEYYQKAEELILSKTNNIHLFIFSDDIEWAKNNLQFKSICTFISHNQDEKNPEDLRLMSSCNHHIIANSGFSWWAAWLNPSDEKIIIAPEKWFNESANDTRDVYPMGWIVI